ncbi:MAG: flippase activity-associated protein Agl23 [Haloplanus sp.]
MVAAEASPGSVRRRIDRVALAVLVVTVVGLAARVVGLGARSFHWDEARVGYWTLRFLHTGAFEYRPVAGGPLLYVLDRHVFALLGATDFTARLVVAVLSGLSPLGALLFRNRLDDGETVALAAMLAASPVLLYYGRFLRGDVPLAVFGLVVVGCAFRLRDGPADSAARAYRYAGAVALALAAASSAFVVGYVVCWLVAAALTLDHRRLAATGPGTATRLRRVARRVAGASRDALGALVAFLVVWLYFYAPRAGGAPGPGLWKPTTFPAVVSTAFLGTARKFVGVRVLGRRHVGTHSLLPYLADHAGTLAAASAVVAALALVGFLADRYGTGATRPVVAFHAYWAGASLFVFPVITEESAPWVAVHTVLPLLVPAAAGAGILVRYASNAFERDDAAGVAAALLVALAVTAQGGALVAGTAYGPTSADNPLVHDAQPADDLHPFVTSVSAAIAGNDGVDVLFYGPEFVPAARLNRPPASDAWGNRLPLPWYLERVGAETGGVRDAAGFDALDERPPVVVVSADRRSELDGRLGGYEASSYHLSLWDREVVVFVRA